MEKRYNDDLGREENALYEEKNGSKHDLSDSELFKKKKKVLAALVRRKFIQVWDKASQLAHLIN